MRNSIRFVVILLSLPIFTLTTVKFTKAYTATADRITITDLSEPYQEIVTTSDFLHFYITLETKSPLLSADFIYSISSDGILWSAWTFQPIETNIIIATNESDQIANRDEEYGFKPNSGRISLPGNSKAIRIKLLDSSNILTYTIYFEPDLSIPKINLKSLPAAGPPPYPFYYIAPVPITTREAWGCPDLDPESPYYCYGMDWPREYVLPTSHVIIHHTATSNTSGDWAAEVRSIWYHHSHVRGWNDIGYNFLIAPTGQIFEGRFGGNGVTAGHTFNHNRGTIGISMLGDYRYTGITSQANASLEMLLTALSQYHQIDYRRFAYDRYGGTPNYRLSGHRDWANTACPGGTFYATLDRYRELGYKLKGKYIPKDLDHISTQ